MTDQPADIELPNAGERYRVEAFLGEGAMGRVYRAYDRQLERPVALKFLRSRDSVETTRILREARAQARLEHEHICRVFDVGEVDGEGFLAMQLVDGAPLSELASGLDLESKVRLVEQAARAVHAAHRSGVVHRDLNPGNLLVEDRPDGNPHVYVVDFGIAREPGSGGSHRDPAAVGAPAFMAPEQLRGEPSGSEPGADVYGLGATLYAVLAGQSPFFAESREATAHHVVTKAPVRLGLVAPGVPAELETITEIAMAKTPERRYADAGSLADDLGRWLSGEAIAGKRSSAALRFRSALKVHRNAVAGSIGVLLVAVLVVAGALWLHGKELKRRALIQERNQQIERMDQVLRAARMLPLHDTRRAEDVVRQELDAVEASLMEHGPLARGSAYAVLGHGHLLLREFESAEVWLAAALDSGLDDARVETALGIARAMLLLEHARDPVADLDVGSVPSVAEAVVNLSRRGSETADLDLFHRALALAVSGRTAEAIDAAHTSASRTPWLYEAAHLEGDLLVDRSKRRSRENDAAGVIADLERAGGAYARGLQIGRSDGWLLEAEAERSMLLARFLEPTDPEVEECLESALEAAERASTIRPDRVEPNLLAARAAVLKADRLRARDGDAGEALATAERALVLASELDPDAPGLIDLQRRVDELRSESRGADSR